MKMSNGGIAYWLFSFDARHLGQSVVNLSRTAHRGVLRELGLHNLLRESTHAAGMPSETLQLECPGEVPVSQRELAVRSKESGPAFGTNSY